MLAALWNLLCGCCATPDTGACCRYDEQSDDVICFDGETPLACNKAGGVYKGDGSLCSGVECDCFVQPQKCVAEDAAPPICITCANAEALVAASNPGPAVFRNDGWCYSVPSVFQPLPSCTGELVTIPTTGLFDDCDACENYMPCGATCGDCPDTFEVQITSAVAPLVDNDCISDPSCANVPGCQEPDPCQGECSADHTFTITRDTGQGPDSCAWSGTDAATVIPTGCNADDCTINAGMRIQCAPCDSLAPEANCPTSGTGTVHCFLIDANIGQLGCTRDLGGFGGCACTWSCSVDPNFFFFSCTKIDAVGECPPSANGAIDCGGTVSI